MSDENQSRPPTGEAEVKTDKIQETDPAPVDPVIGQIVQKIKTEPFLFVIAIVILLVGLVVQATGLASQDLRFVIMIIALLAFAVILGYYILEGWKLYSGSHKQHLPSAQDPHASEDPPSAPSITGKVKAQEISKDAHLGGVKASSAALQYPGSISGEVEVKEAKGGRAYGVELDQSGEADDPKPNLSP